MSSRPPSVPCGHNASDVKVACIKMCSVHHVTAPSSIGGKRCRKISQKPMQCLIDLKTGEFVMKQVCEME